MFRGSSVSVGRPPGCATPFCRVRPSTNARRRRRAARVGRGMRRRACRYHEGHVSRRPRTPPPWSRPGILRTSAGGAVSWLSELGPPTDARRSGGAAPTRACLPQRLGLSSRRCAAASWRARPPSNEDGRPDTHPDSPQREHPDRQHTEQAATGELGPHVQGGAETAPAKRRTATQARHGRS